MYIHLYFKSFYIYNINIITLPCLSHRYTHLILNVVLYLCTVKIIIQNILKHIQNENFNFS